MKTGNEAKPPAVLFCVGTEKWLREQAIQHLKTQWITPGFEEMDWVVFSEPPADHRVILEAVQTLPFGSALRLVVIQNLTLVGKETFPWLADLLTKSQGRSCLVFCVERLEKGMEIFSRERSDLIRIVWCQPLKGRELESWVVHQAKAMGCGIDPEAVALLIRRLGAGLQSLTQAVESLSLFSLPTARITKTHVEALIVPSLRETAFELLDIAAAGRPDQAMVQLKTAIHHGQLTVEQLMGAMGWYYRMVWKTRQGEAGPAWISPQRQAALNRLSRWPVRRLQSALENLLQAEVDVKLGHPAPELLADHLLLQMGN